MKLRRLLAAAALAALGLLSLGAYSPPTYGVIDGDAYGVAGDGVTLNNGQFAAMFAKAASGGRIRLGCGVYKITATPTVNIAAGSHVGLQGSGADCTTILVSGAIDGPTFNFGNQWSSADVSNLTVATDQAGVTNCLVFSGAFTNANSARAAASSVEHVTLRGADAYGSNTEYCANGFNDYSISNLSIVDLTYQGRFPTYAGNAIYLHGSGTGSTYAVQINITNSTINDCAVGVDYGDWVQGVTLNAVNITGCDNGVSTVGGTPAGTLSQLSLVNSQINTNVCGLCINESLFANLQATNNTFIPNANSLGMLIKGSNFSVSDNVIGCTSTTGTIAIDLGSTFGNGGGVDHNKVLVCGTAALVTAASQAFVKIDSNQFVNNVLDYSVSASSSGAIIVDTQARVFATLPACNSATHFSSFYLADSPVSTFNTTVSVGAGANFVGVKCDGSRYYVD